ncbi:hypothetical protein DPMN_192611 [Dreissena polymorpha]|uniref:Uncharacterized protein n=1 Tax=Dreissena polymorpha TaxID=45954 RepID=A0A9D3Y7K0_DREPO|nr:hypothetical protein DPMN_192611 [Dreissena polymorpha]
MLSGDQSMSGRLASPPSQIMSPLCWEYKFFTSWQRSVVYETLLSVGLYKQPMMIGFFKLLVLKDAATNSDICC